MDYRSLASLHIHEDWDHFCQAMAARRLVLISPGGSKTYTDFAFDPQDCLVLGQESSGFPQTILESVPHAVHIPMISGVRSLNVAIAGAIVLSEALRQTDLLPQET